jgi:hypothetical protein
MASLVAKKKGNKLYYYVVESARVDGKSRIVHQAYLGTAEKVADLVKDRTAPVPLSATMRDFGLPGAPWLAAQQTGVFSLLESLWPQPRSGPSPAHYLVLAAIHRICQPGPKTEVSDWYDRTVLHSLWKIPPARFSSQAKRPRAAIPYGRGTFFHAAVRGKLIVAQVVEVGRFLSGAVETKHKRGPKFRAPYSGYSLRQHPRLIPIRRLLPNARLGLYLSRKDHSMSQPKKHSPRTG